MNTNCVEEATQLRDLLDQLRSADVGLRVFGADSHFYIIGDTPSEKDVCAFEQRYSIQLPEDYRCFLMHVGNGGAGPHYGMHGLNDSLEPNGYFPFAEAAYVFWPENGLAPSTLDLNSHKIEEPCGAIRLCEEGCGYFSFLVVNGPAYGTVWNDWEAADCGLVPTGQTFSQWYRAWLDRSLLRIARQPLVDRLQIGMPREEVIGLLGQGFDEKPVGKTSEIMMSYPDAAVTIFVDDGIVTQVARHRL